MGPKLITDFPILVAAPPTWLIAVGDPSNGVLYQTPIGSLLSGPQGNQGYQGYIGFQGYQGNIGVQGFTGPAGGPQGNTGSMGLQGWQGVTGPAGGPQGYQGWQGNQGLEGIQGRQGSIGITGNQGSQGRIGPQGTQGNQGLVGSQGWQGIPGESSAIGATGFQGYQGNIGFQGLVGLQGYQGLIGNIGSQGPIGLQGYQGATGSTGSIWLTGIGEPSSLIGQVNDMYMDTSSGDYYKKDLIGWSLLGNLRAPVDYNGIGTIVDIQQFTASTIRDYLIATGTTLTFSTDGELNIYGTSSVSTSNTTNLPFDINSEKWKFTMRFRANVTTGTQRIGIGTRSTHFRNASATRKSVSFTFDFSSSSADIGKLIAFSGADTTFTQRAISSAISCSNNDIIELELTRDGYTFTGLFNNITAATSSSLTYSYPLQSTSDPILPNTGRPVIYSLHQADVRVLSIKFEELTPSDPYILIIGDSKSAGYNTTTNTDRYITQLQTSYPNQVYAWTGFGDELGDAMMWMSLSRQIRPKNVIIALGSNDRRNSVTDAIITENLERLRDTFQNVGSKVYFLGMSERIISQAILYSRAISIFGLEYCIFTEPSLAADNVHLTTSGHNTIKDAIIAKFFN